MSRVIWTERYVAEHGVIISDEAVDTNSLHSALQVVEILFKKLIFRFLIASDVGWRLKYSWQLLIMS